MQPEPDRYGPALPVAHDALEIETYTFRQQDNGVGKLSLNRITLHLLRVSHRLSLAPRRLERRN